MNCFQTLDMDPSELMRKVTHLETEVTEHRMRSDAFKTNFERLKGEHSKVQQENDRLQRQLTEHFENWRATEDRFQEAVARERQEKDVLMVECEELRSQVMTPHRLELMKHQLAEDLERSYKERLDMVEQELESYKSKFNQLHYDCSFLQSELESQAREHASVVGDLQARHKMETEAMVKERHEWLVRKEIETPLEAQKLRALQRENTQLHVRVKGLLTELEELNAQRDSQLLQTEQASHVQARKLSDLQAMLRVVETERESTQLLCQQVQEQLERGLEEKERLSAHVHQLEKDNLTLKSQLDEIRHSHRVEQSNLKMSLLQSRSEIEQERDCLMAEVESGRTKIHVLERTVDEMTARVAEKENDISCRVQAAVDDELHHCTELVQEKLQLETHIAEVERAGVEREAAHQSDIKQLEEQVMLAENGKECSEKEILQLKTQLQRVKRRCKALETEQVQSQELQQKVQQLQMKYQSLLANNNESRSVSDKLKSQLELLTEELRQVHSNLRHQEEEHAMATERHKLLWDQERQEFGKRISECEQQRQTMSKKLQKTRADAKKLQDRYRRKIDQAKQDVQIVDTKSKQLEMEKEAFKKQLETENNKLRRQLREFHRKQSEFAFLLHSGTEQSGLLSAMAANTSFPSLLPSAYADIIRQEKKNQQELAEVRQKIEGLSNVADDTSHTVSESSQAEA